MGKAFNMNVCFFLNKLECYMKKTILTLAALSFSAVAMAAPKAASLEEVEVANKPPVASIGTPEVVATTPAAQSASAPSAMLMPDGQTHKDNTDTVDGKPKNVQKTPAAILENKP